MSIKMRQNQRGVVSIMVTMIMILVISLIVLGFAQITRRNQRENLDNQLSTQAFYAAETAINDVRPALQQAGTGAVLATNCNGLSALHLSSSLADIGPGVSYTCLNINNTPNKIQYQTIPEDNAETVPLNGTGSFNKLTLSWHANATGNTDSSHCSTNTNLPANSSNAWAKNCAYGLLRLDIVPNSAGSSGNAQGVQQATATYFLKPSGSNSAATPGGGTGVLDQVHCTGGLCSTTITLPTTTNFFYARVSAYYEDLQQVSIQPPSGIGLKGAVAVVDATGKAQDVLRRIQEYIPLTANSTEAAAALQTTGTICKLISVTGTLATNTGCPNTPKTGGTPGAPGGPNTDFNNSCNGQPNCPGSGGGTVDPGSADNWTRYFWNHSSTSASTCTWNWGDGTSTPNVACTPGDSTKHTFPELKTCKSYKVVLTMHYSGGDQSKSQTISVPKVNPDGSPAC